MAALALNACASAGGVPPRNAAPSEYRIGPEDLIEIVVWNSDAVSRRVPVRPDGMISLPLVNDIRAAGLTPLQLREQLANALRKFIPNPEVFVIVQEINSPKVSVIGEVVHPGRYVIKGPTTVLDIVTQAGGLTEFAAASNATVMRTLDGKTERYSVNARANEDLDPRLAVQVEPGDVVVVP
jgi:polysaccharide export outer membrane protein